MKHETLSSFWREYKQLDEPVRRAASKAYRLWVENPFHPSLRFKCIDKNDRTWSVRINKNYRALAFEEDGTFVWFWIGSHDDYERFYS